MPEIKIRLADADLARLTAEAAAAGIPRAHLIRDRALAPAAGVARLRTKDYHSLVADACRFMRGDLSRQHVETLVAYVLTRLDQHSRQAAARD
jgi:hypothetical protein